MPFFLPIAGLALGAAGMYLLDPQQGRRRRAQLRDQAASRARDVRQTSQVALRDLRNRAQGVRAQMWSSVAPGAVPDRVLVSRVRSKLGRYASHPGAIKVEADRARIVLRGHVPAAEHLTVIRAASGVRGVRRVDDRLTVHERTEGISALQGGAARPGEPFELLQATWPPGVRLLSGGAGAAMVLFGLRSRSALGPVLATAGALAIVRAAVNRPLTDVLASSAQRPGNDTQGSMPRDGSRGPMTRSEIAAGPRQTAHPETGKASGESGAAGHTPPPRDIDQTPAQGYTAMQTRIAEGDQPEATGVPHARDERG